MNRVRVETSFQVDANRDLGQAFETLADALFEIESTNAKLEDADVSSSAQEFTLAIVGLADSIDEAASEANEAIRKAIQTSGFTSPVAA